VRRSHKVRYHYSRARAASRFTVNSDLLPYRDTVIYTDKNTQQIPYIYYTRRVAALTCQTNHGLDISCYIDITEYIIYSKLYICSLSGSVYSVDFRFVYVLTYVRKAAAEPHNFVQIPRPQQGTKLKKNFCS
jgi:hypothetical protein